MITNSLNFPSMILKILVFRDHCKSVRLDLTIKQIITDYKIIKMKNVLIMFELE